MDVLSHLLGTFRLQAEVFHNGQYCGDWQVDTSGANKAAFHVITHGCCELLLENGRRHEDTLHAGDVIIFPRDTEHRVASSVAVATPVNSACSISFEQGLQQTGTGLVCGYFQFELQRNEFLLDLLPAYLVIHSHQVPWNQHLKHIVEVLIVESHSMQSGVQVALNRLSELIFMIVLREYLQSSAHTTGLANAFQDDRIMRVLQAVYDQPEFNWSVEDMARIATLSPSAFASRFKELMNESPLQHLKRWRMQNAYRWLRDDGISVMQAAQRSGYATEAAFAKAFKKELQCSPGAVRKAAGKD